MKHRMMSLISLAIWTWASPISAQPPFWQPTNSPTSNAISVLRTNARGDVFAVAEPEVFRTTDLGNTWLGLSTARSVFVETDGNILRADVDNTISRSTDNGSTWIPLVHFGSYEVVTSPIVSNSNGLLITSTAYVGPGQFWIPTGVKRSTDNGSTWQLVRQDSRPKIICVNRAGEFFAGRDLSDGDSSLYRTTDGISWVSARSGLAGSVNGLAFGDGGVSFAATSRGLYLSSNSGDTWISTSLAGQDVRCVDVNPDGDIFAAVDTSVYRSNDTGLHWVPVASGLPDSAVSCIVGSPDGYMYAGICTTGIYRSVGPTTSVHDADRQNPSTVSLLQNYPNPFNSSTTIEFSLPKRSTVLLRVFSVLGEQVQTLVSEEMEAGRHRVIWQAQHMASGTYFYCLRANQLNETKMTVLIR